MSLELDFHFDNITNRSKELEEIDKQIDADMMREMERKKWQEEENERSKISRERNKTSLLQVTLLLFTLV